MSSRVKMLLIIFSVALNISFLTVWTMRSVACCSAKKEACRDGDLCSECALCRELNATEAQRKQMEPIQKDYREKSAALNARAELYRSDMIDLIFRPDPDPVGIRARQDSIESLQRQMQGLVVEHLLAQKSILSADQQKKLSSMMRSCCCKGECSGGTSKMQCGMKSR